MDEVDSTTFADGFVKRLNRFVAGIDAREASFAVRGFSSSDTQSQQRLESIGNVFLAGYNAALLASATSQLKGTIAAFERRFRGFVIEGAAMGCAIADAMPWARLSGPNDRSFTFLTEHRELHPYLSTVGIGWALARIPWRRHTYLCQVDPFLASLAFDGWGFHDVYFKPRRLAKPGANRAVARLGGVLALRSWDQGAGRALWFTSGGQFKAAADQIRTLSEHRRSDLFSGLGLAMTYAAGSAIPSRDEIRTSVGGYIDDLRQGSAFGLEAHVRAGTLHEENQRMAQALTSREPTALVEMVRAEMPARSLNCQSIETGQLAYQHWRARVARALAKHDRKEGQ